jgi:hypothetical protein
MNAARITAGTMSAGRIYGDTLGACLINAGTVNADTILGGTIVADRIAAYSIYGIKLGTGNTNGIFTENLVDQAITQVDAAGWSAGTTAGTGFGTAYVGSTYINASGNGAVYVFFEGSHLCSNGYLDHYNLTVNGTYLCHRNLTSHGGDQITSTISYVHYPGSGSQDYLVDLYPIGGGTCVAYNRSMLALEIKK